MNVQLCGRIDYIRSTRCKNDSSIIYTRESVYIYIYIFIYVCVRVRSQNGIIRTYLGIYERGELTQLYVNAYQNPMMTEIFNQNGDVQGRG